MKVKNLKHWVLDYVHLAHKHSWAFVYRKPPTHYLGHIIEGKNPIILIPGVFEKWHFLKVVADPLSLKGHPIYAVEHIGYNTKEIHRTAKLIRELIEEKNLRRVIIIAHSKGGLIGKYILAFHNQDERVEKVITIATPFQGSGIVKFVPHRALKELSPESSVVQALSERKEVNHRIVSIFGIFDNHVWPESSCNLEGAKNIQVETYGHHRILFSAKVREIIMSEVEGD
jgi:triacylglycerol esterase/lipase EstA (alpha/beta hydrolase family)